MLECSARGPMPGWYRKGDQTEADVGVVYK